MGKGLQDVLSYEGGATAIGRSVCQSEISMICGCPHSTISAWINRKTFMAAATKASVLLHLGEVNHLTLGYLPETSINVR